MFIRFHWVPLARFRQRLQTDQQKCHQNLDSKERWRLIVLSWPECHQQPHALRWRCEIWSQVLSPLTSLENEDKEVSPGSPFVEECCGTGKYSTHLWSSFFFGNHHAIQGKSLWDVLGFFDVDAWYVLVCIFLIYVYRFSNIHKLISISLSLYVYIYISISNLVFAWLYIPTYLYMTLSVIRFPCACVRLHIVMCTKTYIYIYQTFFSDGVHQPPWLVRCAQTSSTEHEMSPFNTFHCWEISSFFVETPCFWHRFRKKHGKSWEGWKAFWRATHAFQAYFSIVAGFVVDDINFWLPFQCHNEWGVQVQRSLDVHMEEMLSVVGLGPD